MTHPGSGMHPLTTPLTCTSTKMNLGLSGTLRWLDDVVLPHAPELARLSFFACLPHPLLTLAQARLGDCGVGVGAQNCWFEGGAVTGEVSAELLAELGCRHVMLGHAERRRLFGEDDDLIARKVAAASGAGLVPLLCVGEDTRLGPEDAARHVVRQAAVLARLGPGRPSLVLYEPAWAIGGDHGASPGHAARVLEALHAALGTAYTRFLYGGSVTPGTYTALRRAAPWDGVAVGRAAQDPGMLRDVTAELLGSAPDRTPPRG
ncbi:triosephosphate isomerase [Streptomyces sp. PRKS01-65]|nr:triose-phosphate isomerase family protein [Streptomyces harenosi]NEY35472.1 triosephosphate isomerase [Streptomyces harenosi]